MKTIGQVVFKSLFYIFYLIETILEGKYPFIFNDKVTRELYILTYSWNSLSSFFYPENIQEVEGFLLILFMIYPISHKYKVGLIIINLIKNVRI